MSKKNFYAVKYTDKTGAIFTNLKDYKNGTKGYSGSSSKGFRSKKEAIAWLNGIPYKIINNSQPLLNQEQKGKTSKIYAIARGRCVGVFEDSKIFNDSITKYKHPIYKSSFNTRKEAEHWLRTKGLSKENKQGIYAVAKGYKTGIFTNLYTYEKNIMDYPNSIGKMDFETKEQAAIWLNNLKRKKRYYVVAKGRRRGVYSDISKYEKNISNLKNSDIIAKGGFKSKEQAIEWYKKATKKEKKYHAVVVGKRRGIYVDKEKFDASINADKNGWGKDNFNSWAEAKQWLDIRLDFLNEIKDDLYKESIIAYESQNLPVVYTDGSYIYEKKQYSSSVVICEKEGHLSTFVRASNEKKNNVDGEVEALLFALQLIVGLYDFKEFILVYDFNSLEKVARNQLKIKSVPHYLQDKIVNIIKTEQLDIHFLNVKSHTGIVGNSVADKIARKTIKELNKIDLLRELTPKFYSDK